MRILGPRLSPYRLELNQYMHGTAFAMEQIRLEKPFCINAQGSYVHTSAIVFRYQESLAESWYLQVSIIHICSNPACRLSVRLHSRTPLYHTLSCHYTLPRLSPSSALNIRVIELPVALSSCLLVSVPVRHFILAYQDSCMDRDLLQMLMLDGITSQATQNDATNSSNVLFLMTRLMA